MVEPAASAPSAATRDDGAIMRAHNKCIAAIYSALDCVEQEFRQAGASRINADELFVALRSALGKRQGIFGNGAE